MLQIQELEFTAWGRRFFDRASVIIPDGMKVGLVGRNGVGKSTLFKLIKGELSPGGGEIRLPRGARIGAVDQEHPASPVTLIDTILAADEERSRLLEDLETAAPERLGEIYQRLEEIGADRAPSRAAEILTGLGFSPGDLTRPMAEFSGGWRMRVALAAALFAEPELLLLDEPTNYLDLEGALWLEARLRKHPKTALVISHDRELLNACADAILHLGEGKLELYTGGYDAFEARRAERARQMVAAKTKQDAERAHLQAFVDRFRAKASKAAQAQSRLKRLSKLTPISLPPDERAAPFILPSPTRVLAPPLVRLENASVGYDGHAVLKRLDVSIDVEDRIGLLGVNGAGKSTFAKLIAGALQPMTGQRLTDRRMSVGWFHQHQIEALDPETTPLEIVRAQYPHLAEAQRRSRLAQWGFPAQKQETRAEDLSGGERARLLLNLVADAAPHLLILDEPTNHLDIDSRRLLLDALNDYQGAVLLITHDRSLMELVADRLWLAADGAVRPFEGDMDDYARLVVERARLAAKTGPLAQKAAEEPPAPSPPGARSAGPRVSASTLRRRLEEAEAALAAANAQVSGMDAVLADPELYVRRPREAAELGRRRQEAASALAAAEARWIAAAEALEAAEGAPA